MELGDLHKVWEIRALKTKPCEPDARAMLERISKQVQPIMRRRKWRVKLLSEFCPKNPALLGLNVGGGVEVKLRLRRPGRDWDFYSFDHVLDTMLHELCHIERGPHDAQFYRLWDELRKECEELLSKGITGTGQGFDGTGRRLGGFSCQPPLASLRQATLAAAQKRARNGDLLPSGPRRLGGNSEIMTALSPIQAAAMAAERRMYDDLWCGSVSHDESVVAESSGDLPDLVVLSEPPNLPKQDRKVSRGNSVYNEKDGRGKTLQSGSNILDGSSAAAGFHTASVHGGSSSDRVTDDANVSSLWECGACTLLNRPLAPICEVCGAAKPTVAQAKFTTWSCKFCTLENSNKLEKCSACDQWRYSYGPPVATRGPSYGT